MEELMKLRLYFMKLHGFPIGTSGKSFSIFSHEFHVIAHNVNSVLILTRNDGMDKFENNFFEFYT